MRWVILFALGLGLAGCNSQQADETQVFARVNGDELSVHQFNFAVNKIAPKALNSGEREALIEKLIDRQLAVQAAMEKDLDRQAEVMMRLEEARRDILAAAYAEKVAGAFVKPTNEAAARFYAEHPGLFAERKVYRLREIAIPVESPALENTRVRLDKKDDLADIVSGLRQIPGSFTDQSVLRSAEQLPIEVADRLVKVKPGETIAFMLARGLVIYELQSAEAAPLTWQESVPMIHNYLKKQGESALISEDLKRLRSTAKIARNQLDIKP
jgi:EpsD family peptidyl-prolyl cis-trans isomerase